MPVSQGRRNIEERRNGAPRPEEPPVVCRNSTAPPRRQSEPTSRGLSVVEAEKAAEPSPTADLSDAVRGLGGRDQVVVEPVLRQPVVRTGEWRETRASSESKGEI